MKATPTHRFVALSTVCACVALIPACKEKTPPAPKAPSQSVPKATGGPGAGAPAGAPQQNPSAPPAAAPASGSATSVTVGNFTFPLPTGWRSVPPANEMRLAEVLVSDPAGDATKACTVVFSSAGGDVQSNIDRWANQVHDAAGQPGKPKVEKKTLAGVPVSIVEVTGSYSGMGEPAPHPNWTLRGAIIEDAGGTLFIKMTGPAEQMAASAPGFASMVDGMTKR